MVIQRIQTLFLLFAVVSMGFFLSSVINYAEPGVAVKVYDNPYYLYPAIVSLLVSLWAVFLYKKMRVQRRFVAVAGVISGILLICNLFGMFTCSTGMSYSAPICLFAATLFNWLAIRSINKDARLLADSNRLR